MFRKILFLLPFLLLCGQAEQAIAADKPDTYRLHPGDTVLVSVWRNGLLCLPTQQQEGE